MNRSRIDNERNTGSAIGRAHLEDYLRVVWRRGWLVLLITGVSLAGAVWAASRQPPLYRASLTLQVGDPRGRTGQVGTLEVSPSLLWTDPVESEVQQLTTRAVAEFAVDSLQLRAETEEIARDRLLESVTVSDDARIGEYRVEIERDSISIEQPGSGVIAHTSLGVPLEFHGVRTVFRPDTESGSYVLRIISDQQAVSRVRNGLAASVRPETNLIDVTFTSHDAGLTPRILNAVAAGARLLGVQRIRHWARSRTDFISDQLEGAGQELQTALEAVERYKERKGLTSLSSEESRLLRRISELQSQLENLVIERNIYNDLIRQISTGAVNPEELQKLATVSDVSENRAVQFYFDRLLQLLEERADQVSGQAGKDPSHPQVVALDNRIDEVQNRLLSAAENAAATLQSRISAIDGSLSRLQVQLRQFPTLETELQRLKHQVEIQTDMYKYLLSRYREAEIAEAEISPYLEIVDAASWARPVAGGKRLNIVIGGLIGLLLGLGAVFFVEYLDRSVQSTVDLESGLGLAVLGWIPQMTSRPGQPFPLVAIEDPGGPAAEAYRVLRTNLAFSTAREERLVTLLFTSPGPGEGKSTTAANLSAVLAARGDRTLLVDGDVRRGELHHAFDLLRAPGLTDLLVGDLDIREAIRPDVRPGLDILPAGQRPPNPSELLGSQGMADILVECRDHYRWILLDAPPVLAVTDPAVLATLSDGALLIVKAGETDQRVAWRALQQLERVGARVVGAVLNKIRPSRSPDGYYVDYYYARYEDDASDTGSRPVTIPS